MKHHTFCDTLECAEVFHPDFHLVILLARDRDISMNLMELDVITLEANSKATEALLRILCSFDDAD